MITLKNKHKTKDVTGDLGKALHYTWEESALRFSGALTACKSLCIGLLVMLPPLQEG